MDGAALQDAVTEMAPATLYNVMRWQACANPSDRAAELVRHWKRLAAGRGYRQSVLPQARQARVVKFSPDLELMFCADHPAARPFMNGVMPAAGVHEPELVEYLIRTVRAGDVVVDIGAHVGYVSCVAAALGATVIAAEIQPTLVPMIQLNASLNELWTVHALCVQIGDRVGLTSTFRLNPSPGMQSSVDRIGQSQALLTSVNHDCIPCMTLDSLFGDAPYPALVKIDVEGAEGSVLAGARGMIAAAKTKFVVEIHGRLISGFGTTLANLLEPFAEDVWSLSILTVDGLQPLSRESFLDPDGPIATHRHNAPVLFEPLQP